MGSAILFMLFGLPLLMIWFVVITIVAFFFSGDKPTRQIGFCPPAVQPSRAGAPPALRGPSEGAGHEPRSSRNVRPAAPAPARR